MQLSLNDISGTPYNGNKVKKAKTGGDGGALFSSTSIYNATYIPLGIRNISVYSKPRSPPG